MHNAPAPNPDDLPSSRSLLRSTLIAAVAAVAILVTFVLPAEYGVDPTGIGNVLGLKEMGEIKMQLAREAAIADSIEASLGAAGAPDGAVPVEAVAAGETLPDGTSGTTGQPVQTMDATGTPLRAHVTEISLDPDQGLEIKLRMDEGARVNFSWSASGGSVNYDLHADNESVDYFSYRTEFGVQSHDGVLVAAFDGYHGWFWRNRTDGVVTVTLRTEGEYGELKLP